MTSKELYTILETTAQQAESSRDVEQIFVATILYAVCGAMDCGNTREFADVTYKFVKESTKNYKEKIERLTTPCQN